LLLSSSFNQISKYKADEQHCVQSFISRSLGYINVSNSEVSDVLNIIIIKKKKKANTKSSEGKHGLPIKAKVGSGAIEE
jgi:hypothetical protein